MYNTLYCISDATVPCARKKNPMVFLSTLPAGLEKPIERRLVSEVRPIRVFSVSDGLAVYDTRVNSHVLQNLPYLNNSFALLKKLNARKSFEQAADEVCACRQLPGPPKGMNSFRVMFSQENTFVSINKTYKEKLERFISAHFGMRLSGNRADMEFWLMKRSGGDMYFVRRLPGKAAGEPMKGKLRAELADMMCYLAHVGHGDCVWDPFCGYGAIPEAAVRYKPAVVFAGDTDPKCVAATRRSDALRLALQNRQHVDIRQSDIFDASTAMPMESVDKIITDPPWGIYDKKLDDIDAFYTRMFRVFSDMLKPGGLIVILTSRDTDLQSALGWLTLAERYGVLVNGKKANMNIIMKGEMI